MCMIKVVPLKIEFNAKQDIKFAVAANLREIN